MLFSTAPPLDGADFRYICKIYSKMVFMKKCITLFATLLATAALAFSQNGPTTTWPYVYDEFQDGALLWTGGKEQNGKFNICLADNKLHFIEGAYIKAANMAEILSVKIGPDVYQNAAGEMLKVLAKSDKSLVVEGLEVDFAALNETGGAYGSSSTTIGTTALSSLEGIGGTNSSQNINHMELKLNKENGKALSLIVKKYIFVKGRKIFASKRDFMEVPGLDKEAAKAFLKGNKIKWSKVQDILKAGDFLADTIN